MTLCQAPCHICQRRERSGREHEGETEDAEHLRRASPAELFSAARRSAEYAGDETETSGRLRRDQQAEDACLISAKDRLRPVRTSESSVREYSRRPMLRRQMSVACSIKSNYNT